MMSKKYVSINKEIARLNKVTTYETLNTRDVDPKKLATGYEGQNVPDFQIPECSIEDLDKSVFDLFDKQVMLSVFNKDGVKKVPIVFATGERFALVKKKKPIRDSDGLLVIPVISIRRNSINQNVSKGMGINVSPLNDIVIKRQLSDKDRNYQKTLNRNNVLNQDNVASEKSFEDVATERGAQTNRIATRRTSKRGYVSLESSVSNNIVEIITMPYPRFYEATYEITFWTQYTQQMNSMIEQLLIAAQPPQRSFKLSTEKGYWFVGYLSEDLSSGANFDDFTDQERIIRYTFTMTAVGYLVGNAPANKLSPLRYHMSTPQISFGMIDSKPPIQIDGRTPPFGDGKPDFTLNDVSALDSRGVDLTQRGSGDQREVEESSNPVTGDARRQLVRVETRNQRSGETVIRKRKLDDDFLF